LNFILTLDNYIFVINILLALIVILFERKKPSVTMSWLLVMLFIPIVGFLLYIFLGQDLRKKRLFYVKADEEKLIYASVKQQDDFLNKDMLEFNNKMVALHKDFIHLNINSQALFTQDNSLKVFNRGTDLFASMFEHINSAQSFVHLEYYKINNDALGNELIALLAKKAQEGIEVKLLYDGMGCIRLNRKFFAPLIEAGGEVQVFFPPFIPYINLRINYRNHRKITVIDGKYGYIGGFNVGDEYLGKGKKYTAWRDTHLFISGSAVRQLELRFLLDWRYAHGLKNPFDFTPRYFPPINFTGKTAVQIVSSGPDSKWSPIRDAYLKMINKGRKNIYIHTPYFIPDDSILSALKLAALSGVDVRLIIPEKSDHMFVHWAALSYIGELLEADVKVYFYNQGFLHSKMIAVDGFIGSIGTANLDIRSFELNFEINAFIFDRNIVRQLEEHFIEDLSHSTQFTLEDYKNRKTTVRIKEAMFRLLSPLL